MPVNEKIGGVILAEFRGPKQRATRPYGHALIRWEKNNKTTYEVVRVYYNEQNLWADWVVTNDVQHIDLATAWESFKSYVHDQMSYGLGAFDREVF